MRNGSHRLWLCIAAAVAGTVIAVPAASADVVKHDTELTIAKDRTRFYHGRVISEPRARECEDGRRVVVFKQRPGADRKLGTTRSEVEERDGGTWEGVWGLVISRSVHRVYAKVQRKESDRFVCRRDRSATLGDGDHVR